MFNLILAVYLTLCVRNGVEAYRHSKSENKGKLLYIVGITLGSMMWIIPFIIGMIQGIINLKKKES